MLTEKEREEIQEEIGHYLYPQAVCIDALAIVQKHRGWVTDDAVKDVAELLGMSAHEVDGVATFYNLIYRRPVGRHVVHLCSSISCWVMGCETIGKHLEETLGVKPGETTGDGRLTLLSVQCLGDCDHAPAILVDGELHHDLTPQKAGEILRELE